MISFNNAFPSEVRLKLSTKLTSTDTILGDKNFNNQCNSSLESILGSSALTMPSCTAALEATALLLDIQAGDEIILPSYTFVSTANAFVLRGATPVFLDIRPDTLNINEELIEDAITERTKAIVVVHYAGVSCKMDPIIALGEKYDIPVIEDAAQAIMSKYRGRPLGTIGALGTFSFHETKNISCGEGGALIINDPEFFKAAQVIQDKGTNRAEFLAGEADKYTWVSLGSSYVMSEITAALLYNQLQQAEAITKQRLLHWQDYDDRFSTAGLPVMTPSIPDYATHNGHIYYLLLDKKLDRNEVLARCKKEGVQAIFHYVPLHSSPAGLKYGRVSGEMTVTDDTYQRLIRLPLWNGVDTKTVFDVVQHVLTTM